MDVIAAIRERRSVRRYESKPIPPQDLKTILESARLAPSAANRQPWHFVVVQDPENKQRAAQACMNQTWMAEAGAIIAAVGLPEVSSKWYPVDVAIAMENLVLAAKGLGYGTCWIGAFEEAKVKEALAIPENLSVVALTPLGVPADQPAPRPRKPFEECFSQEKYGQPFRG
jgi:nitroreductase